MKIPIACALVVTGVALASAEQLARTIGDTGVSEPHSVPTRAEVLPPTRSIGDYVAGYYPTNSNNFRNDELGTQGNPERDDDASAERRAFR
jgi:hypothetical protein